MLKKLCYAAIVLATLGLTACVEEAHEHHRYYASAYHDEDRDGIRNPNDADRDGDGVVNSSDRYPDDPRYH